MKENKFNTEKQKSNKNTVKPKRNLQKQRNSLNMFPFFLLIPAKSTNYERNKKET